MTFIKNPFHIWNVIRNPLRNSIIFQDGFLTTNQLVFYVLYIQHVYTMNLILPWINRIQLMTCVGIGFHGKFHPFFLVAIDFSKM